MKKIATVLVLMIFLGSAAYAQTAIAGMTYQISVPTGNTKDFMDNISFVGFGVEGRRFFGENFSVGLSFQWNTFRKEVRDEGLPSRPEVSIDHNRDMASYPLLLTTHAYLRKSEKFIPYAGIGIGTFRIHQRADATTQVWKRDSWHWGVSPEVGFIAKLGFDIGLTASLKYNYAFKTSEAPAQTYVTIVAGFLWMHH